MRFRKRETHTNAPQRHNTLQTMAIEVREVKRQLLGKLPRGLPHLRELLLFCACVRAAANLQPNLETTCGEEIPCPDLRLRSGRNTPFRCIFRSWKFRTNIRLHIHAVYTDLTLGESCRDRDLWLTSGYHKQQCHVNNLKNEGSGKEIGPPPPAARSRYSAVKTNDPYPLPTEMVIAEVK